MFAVEGWKLGEIVAQTPPPKKLKRKRGEGEDGTEGKVVPATRPSTNPFMMRKQLSGMDEPDLMPLTGDLLASAKKKKKKKLKHPETTETKPNHEEPNSSMKPSSKKRKPERNHRKLNSTQEEASGLSKPEQQPDPSNHSSRSIKSPRIDAKLTPLQQKMRARLSGSQFRHINEILYTTDSSEALSLFTAKPSLFHEYHEGFRHQVQSWPTNPIDVFIDLLSKSPKPRLIVADLGCGDAALARHFRANKRVIVHSYDLAKVNEFVQVCDMAQVPLRDNTVDVAIFCLSLMGTNFLRFIREACRYTKLQYPPFVIDLELIDSGEIWIAEIKSRFLDPSFENFIKGLKGMGLKLIELNEEEKMFVIMRFERVEVLGSEDMGLSEEMLLKACLYKKR